MKCIYKAPNNFCLKHSTEGTIEFCVEGPCPDEVMAEELDRQYHDFRRGVSDWTQYFRELKAYNAELAGMVIEYLDDIIPGYRERAEKAERERRAVLERLGEFGGCLLIMSAAHVGLWVEWEPRLRRSCCPCR